MGDVTENIPVPEETIPIVKQGETPIEVSVGRSRHGVTVRVKTHPMVEDFIRAMGSGDQEDVKIHGRHWVGIPRESPLLVYSLSAASDPGVLYTDHGDPFVINRPGRPILIDPEGSSDGRILGGRDRPTINLSLLRLVGTSEGIGVTFGIKGVFTDEELRRLKSKLGGAAARFYNSYLKPVNYTVTLHSQEF